ncbi:MAG: TetR/AcrR family transcriptional regulator [Acutalibacter sp.]|jgi:AcrR family transcriptional regulator
MNKSESKYFHTAQRMDEALIELLEQKDLEYITVKELCQQAGVNRSTFYLHYETISDLLTETMETINQRFLSYFSLRGEKFPDSVDTMELQELMFVTREYLLPYLRFIRDNKKVYRAAFRNPSGMQVQSRYGDLKHHILGPVLERFQIPTEHRPYYMAYYVEGIIAIIKEWLRQDCQDDVEMIAGIIEACVRPDRDGGLQRRHLPDSV